VELNNTRVLLTGAAGGIGRELATRLAAHGARLALLDLHAAPLEELAADLPGDPLVIAADITATASRREIAAWMIDHWQGHVDILINNAGVMDFTAYEMMSPEAIRRTLNVNVEAPMQLTRMYLPDMLKRDHGAIVFTGSILGALGMPYFSAYSASKFAIRGFAESLRRELGGTGVQVNYIGPRSVKTPLNNSTVQRMATATGMKVDEPAWVAEQILAAIHHNRPERHLGFPERLFARLNGILPRLIDRGLAGQGRQMRTFACEKG